MDLSHLKPAKGATKKSKRVGRGQGSDLGQTAGRGNNGAKSRSGYVVNPGFEGGGLPIHRRAPKYGFKNINKKEFAPVNLGVLQKLSEDKNLSAIDKDTLVQNGLVPKNKPIKVLGSGQLSASLEVKVDAFSSSAKNAIEQNGGKAINL